MASDSAESLQGRRTSFKSWAAPFHQSSTSVQGAERDYYKAIFCVTDLCNFSSPSNWTRWLLSGRLHYLLDKRIGPVRYLVSWWIWARCLISWWRWSGQPSTRESPENFVWHTFDKVAEQGEATAIIRWEIFSNRPRMFKSIEKARRVFILLSFLSVFEQFHNFDNFRQDSKRGREFIFTLHIWLFYFFFYSDIFLLIASVPPLSQHICSINLSRCIKWPICKIGRQMSHAWLHVKLSWTFWITWTCKAYT